MKKRLPKRKNEDEERDVWSENDCSEYLDWKSAGGAGYEGVGLSIHHEIRTWDLRSSRSYGDIR
ncbi:MAG: CopG family antitoxin [Chloroflexota bacterium]